MDNPLLAVLQQTFGTEVVADAMAAYSPMAVVVPANLLPDICQFLYENEAGYFDQLSCITGLDQCPTANEMQVAYSLYSIPYNRHLTIVVNINREQPEVPTISHIWRAADWHEREAFDLLGIQVANHPDLRRILLPTDWVGHPLKKDYKDMDTYHGLPMKREEKSNSEAKD